ncbi:hypothetical protein GUITHDRAFT_106213 [Guillardia theta CCMP2712]|uniref:Right handed beta helix domain-containing protein n=1 Tax=Guillardia theta (strain CCMP2712) TaxID=905079 RepID=L1JII0_GUITC|nr:hypothetical protein GUITHDRAFT_106213 [Guillardia theta CCMP2712]EKX48137.1 hypothetical protein GUITHDRAFT_106213 [Guillardia theta CCMP2712]|eukprot:XP_005835117.1 hypothetical protein GUITHDRAFT_106213 [Guillardia theta CCMP2712]
MYHCESSSLLLVLSLLLACLEICGSPSHRPESRRQKEFQLSDLIPELRTYPELMPCEEEEQTRSRRPRHIPDEIRLGSKRGDKEKEEEEEEEEEEDVPWSQLLKDSRRAQLLSSSFIEMQAGLQQGNETEDEEASELAAVEAQQGDGDRSRVKSKFLSHRAEQIVLRSVANHKESPRAFISALSSLAPGLLEAMDKNLDVTLEGGTFFSFLQSIVIDGKINIRGQNSSSKVYTTWTLTEGSAGKLQGCSLVWTASNDLDEVQTVLMRGSSWQFEGCRLFCGGDCALRVENGELASSNPVPDCVVLDSIKTMLSHKPSVVSLVDCEIGGLDDDNMNVKEKNTLHAFAYSGINLRDDSECVMQRSRIRGMEGFAVRLEDFSGLHMANCEITKSPVGILARDSCKLLLDGCTLQNMSFGGALVCSSSAEALCSTLPLFSS